MSLAVRLSGQKVLTGNIKPARANPTDQISQVLGFGTGEDTMSQIVLQTRSLGPGASETLDLYDGSTNVPAFVDILNDAATFRVIRGFAMWIDDGGDDSGVTVGNAASNANTLWWGGTTPTQTIYPGGAPMAGGSDAGVAVTTSARNLKVLNNGAESVTYTIAVAGSTAVSGAAMGVLGLTYP